MTATTVILLPDEAPVVILDNETITVVLPTQVEQIIVLEATVEGPSATHGSTLLNFGLPIEQTVSASAQITGQHEIRADSVIFAWFSGDTTEDHSADEHIMATAMIDLACSAPTPGIGFILHGLVRENTMSGEFKIRWMWR